MNKLNSFKVSSVKTATTVDVPINHIFVIDCSGSMYYDLPKIRIQMKNKLPSLVKKDDTVSLVWFSSKGEFGKLVEKVNVNDLNDLNRLNTAIDRWLQPMSLTGFVEPLRTVKDLHTDEGVYSLMFLTDGCDNQWSRGEILGASQELAELMANAVFVEYGMYCNHTLLTEMAEKVNGSVLFAENFDKYDPIFDGIVKRKVSARRIEVNVGTPVENFVWSCSDAGAISYKVTDGKVYVPEDVDEVYWFTDGVAVGGIDWKPLYQGLSALALNRKSGFVKKQLSDIGDVALFRQYSNSFGKQNLYDFAEKLKIAGTDETLRFTAGKQVGVLPDDNAYTVLDLIHNLRNLNAQINLKKFKYNRIGRATEMSSELSKAETMALSEGIAESESVSEIKKLTDSAMKLASERANMKFSPASDVVRIGSFTYNETRPNVSMLFNIKGKVGLPSDAPSVLPKDFDTCVYRNYTIVKDGMLNVQELPVVATKELTGHLDANKVPYTTDEDGVAVINLRSLPIINARMVKSVNANELADLIYQSFVQKASTKVYKAFLEELLPAEKSEQIRASYGDDVAEYLKSIGITDSGFSPKTTLAQAVDKYMSVELAVKFKGLSTIPSFNAFKKKIDAGKSLGAGEELLKGAYDECVANKASMPEADFIKWLESKIDANNVEFDETYRKIVESKFSIVVGQTWFSDLDINNPRLTNHGIEVEFEIKDAEVEI